jgi:Chaperone of endosialidase
MSEKDMNKGSGAIGLPAGKEPYSRPVLRAYGMLHRVTQGSGTFPGDAGSGMMLMPGMMMMSDRRLKQNIVKIGNHPLGFGLYLFDYKPEYRKRCGEGRHFGVMADEVEKVMPSAVVPGFDGFKAVNYDRIGISFPD